MTVKASPHESSITLLQLPDPCLVAILRCCAYPGSICSAARAHSRLHQAAVLALTVIATEVTQQQLDNLMDVYLPSHGQHIDSISLDVFDVAWVLSKGEWSDEVSPSLRQLPPTLTKLSSLSFREFDLQLQPGGGHRGVLGAAALPALKQLRLDCCTLLDGVQGLAAALALLPELEHLAVGELCDSDGDRVDVLLSAIMPGMQQLTYLELNLRDTSMHNDENDAVAARDARDAVLQHLTALTRLVDLRLVPDTCSITASMLSGAQHLTRLELTSHCGKFDFEPAALAGKTLLQHLQICLRPGGGASTARLLCELQRLQQLTCLQVFDDFHLTEVSTPAAAYSALTASSKLQALNVSFWSLPEGVWQHVFPASRQLPHLQLLRIHDFGSSTVPTATLEGTRLVSCCPGLRSLDLPGLQYSTGLLAPLQGLNSLTGLRLTQGSPEGVDAVGQLIRLRRLEVQTLPDHFEGLAQLRQLTFLSYWVGTPEGCKRELFQSKVGFGCQCNVCAPSVQRVWFFCC
jgi:hypothetical protein